LRQQKEPKANKSMIEVLMRVKQALAHYSAKME
jgi:hypothetical protein